MNSQSYSTSCISSRTVKTIVYGTHRTDSMDVPIIIGSVGKLLLRPGIKIGIDARTMDAAALREAAWLFNQLADVLDEYAKVEHDISF